MKFELKNITTEKNLTIPINLSFTEFGREDAINQIAEDFLLEQNSLIDYDVNFFTYKDVNNKTDFEFNFFFKKTILNEKYRNLLNVFFTAKNNNEDWVSSLNNPTTYIEDEYINSFFPKINPDVLTTKIFDFNQILTTRFNGLEQITGITTPITLLKNDQIITPYKINNNFVSYRVRVFLEPFDKNDLGNSLLSIFNSVYFNQLNNIENIVDNWNTFKTNQGLTPIVNNNPNVEISLKNTLTNSNTNLTINIKTNGLYEFIITPQTNENLFDLITTPDFLTPNVNYLFAYKVEPIISNLEYFDYNVIINQNILLNSVFIFDYYNNTNYNKIKLFTNLVYINDFNVLDDTIYNIAGLDGNVNLIQQINVSALYQKIQPFKINKPIIKVDQFSQTPINSLKIPNNFNSDTIYLKIRYFNSSNGIFSDIVDEQGNEFIPIKLNNDKTYYYLNKINKINLKEK